MSRLRSVSPWGLLAALGLWLAAPSALADRPSCENGCASSASENMERCTARCSEPSSSAAGSCSQRCSQRFEQAFKTCSSRCPQPEGTPGKKKSPKREPADEASLP